MYFKRHIDKYLEDWASSRVHKPLLLRGARQVGKSTAVRHLGKGFKNFVELNLERNPDYHPVFQKNLEVLRIVAELSALSGKRIVPGETLLFLDEIQMCPEAIMALRFFKEDMPELHVVAAGSLLEFVLDELPTFGVGRILSMFMYPFSFYEFLGALGQELLIEAIDSASASEPLPDVLHEKLVMLFRTYLMVGGMPEAVGEWVESKNYLNCQIIQDSLLKSYEQDFAKYKKKVDPVLLRRTLRSSAVQASQKFVYSKVGEGYKPSEVKKALELLILAGLLVPVVRTEANGLPLGASADDGFRKILPLDSGLMLRLLNMETGSSSDVTAEILTASAADLVNRGTVAEVVAGLEMLRYRTPLLEPELYFWLRASKNSQAEVDYVTAYNQRILPIEVKSGVQGGMKSLWYFMDTKHLQLAVRTSLENFALLQRPLDRAGEVAVKVCPLYGLWTLPRLLAE